MGGFIEELDIYDQQLVLMETKVTIQKIFWFGSILEFWANYENFFMSIKLPLQELNKLLKKRGVPKRKQKDIKQRRRTLKNRFDISM